MQRTQSPARDPRLHHRPHPVPRPRRQRLHLRTRLRPLRRSSRLGMGLLSNKDTLRFFSKFSRTGGCWQWKDKTTAAGYGNFSVGGRKGERPYAHRISYELHRGPIPAGKQIDHLCRNRGCVRPDHLEAVPQRINLLRGQTQTAKNASKKTCLRGHALPQYQEGKKRQCPPCHNLTKRLRRTAHVA